ncbi:MAG: hypothetical protein ACKOXO_06605 [Cyanobium sp.]
MATSAASLLRRLPVLLLPCLLAIALPAGACERHLNGHQNSVDSAQEASRR